MANFGRSSIPPASGLASHAPPRQRRTPKPRPFQKSARFINFDKSHKKEQGLFLSGSRLRLALQLPLIGSGEQGKDTSDYLAFPHAPRIFDWPVDKYLPIMIPELTFGDKVIVPAFYGKTAQSAWAYDNPLSLSTISRS